MSTLPKCDNELYIDLSLPVNFNNLIAMSFFPMYLNNVSFYINFHLAINQRDIINE